MNILRKTYPTHFCCTY